MRVLACEMRVIVRDVELHPFAFRMNVLWAASAISMSCFNALRVDLESDNDLAPMLAGSSWSLPPTYHDGEMVIDKIPWLSSDWREIFVAQFKTCCIVFVALINRHEARSTRQVVDDPFSYIPIFDQLLRPLNAISIRPVAAQILALLILAHGQIVVRCHDSVTSEHLAQIQRNTLTTGISCMLFARRRTDEWEVIVGIL